MPFGLGFFATAGAGAGAAGSFDLLETQVLTGSATSVSFSSLSTYASTYQHLQIRAVTKTTVSGASADLFLRVNGDTSSNYSYHFLRGVNSSGVVSGASSTNYIFIGQGNKSNTTNAFGAMVIDLLDAYETTKFKTVRSLSGNNNSPDSVVGLNSGSWRSTTAISSLTIGDLDSGSFVTGSRFSLYGLKAA